MLNKLDGFTLIELLIIIMIIGVLASVMVPILLSSQKRTYDAGSQTCAKSIQNVQAIQLIDNLKYSKIGAGGITSSTDGIDHSCRQPQIYISDRSDPIALSSNYTIDIWDKRGSKVFTITASEIQPNAPGATTFSDTGSGGINLP